MVTQTRRRPQGTSCLGRRAPPRHNSRLPIHDWTRTYAGAFHHFHGTWLFRLAEALNAGILPPGYYAPHVVLIDLHPPSAFDPQGIHNLIWAELGQPPVPFSHDRPLQVVSYRAAGSISSFIEPRAVGETLPDAPLFLTPSRFVALPLDETYRGSFAALPANLKREVAGP